MLRSADLHETILTPVICHKHVRYHDAVFLREVSIGRSKEDVKTKQPKKKKEKKEKNFEWTLVNTENLRV